MAKPAQDGREALYDAYCAVPQHQRAEIIHGTLYVSPRPAPAHANATSVLAGELNGAFQRGRSGPGGWWILFEPELQLVALEPMVPDLAGWRVERMPELPQTPYFTTAPATPPRPKKNSAIQVSLHLKNSGADIANGKALPHRPPAIL